MRPDKINFELTAQRMCASVVSPHRQTAGSTTRECVRRKAASFKSASIYECFPFTWPYNALPFLVTYGVSSARSEEHTV